MNMDSGRVMKRLIGLLLVLCLFTACSDDMVIDGVRYETYGFANQDEVKSPKVRYRLVFGNLVWSILLGETVVAPIYFIGWDLFEPVELADCATHYKVSCSQ